MELVSIETEAENSQIAALLRERQSRKLEITLSFYGLDDVLGR